MEVLTEPDNDRLYDPNRIFLYAFGHATSKAELIQEFVSTFGVDDTTVLKWGSINESTRRRNPIGAILKTFKIFWLNCRPAAFQIQGALKEIEMSLQTSPPLTPFDALELIQELRKATHVAEQLHARQSAQGAYLDIISEIQAIGSLFMERVVSRVPSPPSALRRLSYDPRTPEAYR